MDISSLEHDREEKIRSLLCDRLSEEKRALVAELDALPISAEQGAKLDGILQFALAQNYGEKVLQKYYASHPIRVARFVAAWQKRHNSYHFECLVAALVHNVLEKNVISAPELTGLAGEWVAGAVGALTVDRDRVDDENWLRTYYLQIERRDHPTGLLKFFDKFDNLYAICLSADSHKRETYILEIERYIKPIQARLAPELSAYFDELIRTARVHGYRSIESYQKLFAEERAVNTES